jgi:hypothetical protein
MIDLVRKTLPSLLGVGLAIALAAFPAPLNAQKSGSDGAPTVRVEIETDKTHYRIGDSVMVRLTLHNTSSQPILFQNETYTGLVDLRVIDQAGHSVGPTVSPLGVRVSGPLRTFPAGESMTLLYWRAPPQREWLNLRDWGFEIPKPGRYRILGTSSIGSPASTPGPMNNEAIIVIEK